MSSRVLYSIVTILFAFLFASLSLFVCWCSLVQRHPRLAEFFAACESKDEDRLISPPFDLIHAGSQDEDPGIQINNRPSKCIVRCQDWHIHDDVGQPCRMEISRSCKYSILDLSHWVTGTRKAMYAALQDIPSHADGADLSHTEIRSLTGISLPEHVRMLKLNGNSFSQNAFVALAECAKNLEKISLIDCRL